MGITAWNISCNVRVPGESGDYSIIRDPESITSEPLEHMAQVMPEATKIQAAQTTGKYELIRPIGDGNTGTVYLARDRFSLHDVAVKISTPNPADDDCIARWRRKLVYIEAKAAGMLVPRSNASANCCSKTKRSRWTLCSRAFRHNASTASRCVRYSRPCPAMTLRN